MSETLNGINVLDPIFQPMLEFWTKSIEQNQECAKALAATMRDAGDLKVLQRRWLDSLGKSLEMYMRTPAFLESMRQHFEAMTEVKTRAEEVAQEGARQTGIPRMSDVSGLFERLRISQDAILTKLENIERRLDALQKPRKNNGS